MIQTKLDKIATIEVEQMPREIVAIKKLYFAIFLQLVKDLNASPAEIGYRAIRKQAREFIQEEYSDRHRQKGITFDDLLDVLCLDKNATIEKMIRSGAIPDVDYQKRFRTVGLMRRTPAMKKYTPKGQGKNFNPKRPRRLRQK
jgi:hypothetical protein